MLTRFLDNVMFLEFNFMFLHIRVFFPTFDIKSFKDSQMVHLAKIDPLFYTSTYKCFFFSTDS